MSCGIEEKTYTPRSQPFDRIGTEKRTPGKNKAKVRENTVASKFWMTQESQLACCFIRNYIESKSGLEKLGILSSHRDRNVDFRAALFD